MATFDYYAQGTLLREKQQQAMLVSHDFPRWALSLVPISTGIKILDAGCGWGRFTWRLIEDHGVPSRDVVALDPSLGMLRTFGEEATARSLSVLLWAASASAPPFRPVSFGGVIAAHMLYELDDAVAGVSSLAAVLRPDGWLLATTNSDSPLPLLFELHYAALQELGLPSEVAAPGPFNMENGSDVLRTAFEEVERYDFGGMALVTPEEFAASYRATGTFNRVFNKEQIPIEIRNALAPTFVRLAAERSLGGGIVEVPYAMGAFVGRGPRPNGPRRRF